MSPYLLLYVYIVVFACISWRLKKNVVNLICFITLSILFLFLSLRYGQGTDYFGYELLFNYWKDISNIGDFRANLNDVHGEYLWSVLGYSFNKANLSFQFFIIVLAIVEIYMMKLYLDFYCSANMMWAILMLFPTTYLTYMFSGLRQGLVICIFAGIMLSLLRKRKIVEYYACAFLLMFIHSCSISLFVIPLFRYVRIKILAYVLIASVAIGILSGPAMPYICTALPIRNLLARIGSEQIYLLAVVERIFMFTIVSLLYYKISPTSDICKMLYKIYIYSLSVYFIFIWYSLIASRLNSVPRIVEIALIIQCLSKLPKIRRIVCCILLFLNIAMYCKNVNSYIVQGDYTDSTKIWNYPYITIFNKESINQYRTGLKSNQY